MLSPLEQDSSGTSPYFLMVSGRIRLQFVHYYYTVYDSVIQQIPTLHDEKVDSNHHTFVNPGVHTTKMVDIYFYFKENNYSS